ncbi:MAG TPA: hypothetical protein VFI00_20665 [Kribbella sp.]|nr:hypothetical protein [Kribbella sp.]
MMNRIPRVAGMGLGVVMTAAALLPASGHAATSAVGDHRGTVFVQTDAVAGNAVVVYDRAPGGTLRAAGTYLTGGQGGVLSGTVVDHLASQGSVVFDRTRDLLYVVNAGSNSVSVFSVAGDRLIRRQVISSGGTFPVSIAVHGNLVYVLNALDGGAVQGFLRVGTGLVRIPAWHRALGLDPESTSTPGQVAFTPDGSKLVVTTKDNGSAIDVFRVSTRGSLSAGPTVTVDPGGPFAVTFDAGGHLVIAESGANAVATYTIRSDGTASLIDREATGQAATCWIVSAGTAFYASNAGSGTLAGYRDHGDGMLRAIGTTGTDPGTVDAAVSSDDRYLYVQTGANGIVDEFRIGAGGALTRIGSVTVPGAVGADGIAAS